MIYSLLNASEFLTQFSRSQYASAYIHNRTIREAWVIDLLSVFLYTSTSNDIAIFVFDILIEDNSPFCFNMIRYMILFRAKSCVVF